MNAQTPKTSRSRLAYPKKNLPKLLPCNQTSSKRVLSWIVPFKSSAVNNPYIPISSRIQQYSPTDNNKANDRQVNRRNNVKFEPKATVDILKLGDPPEILTAEQKKNLVTKYLEVIMPEC